MKRGLLVISMFFFSLGAFSQSDALEELIKNPEFTPALTFLMLGDFDSCVLLLDSFDSSHSNYNSIIFLKSQCHWELRDYQSLKKDMEFLLKNPDKNSPNYASLLNMYGLSLQNTGDNEKAKAVFKNGYDETKDQILLLNLLAEYNDSGEYEKTITYENELNTDTMGILYYLIGTGFFEVQELVKAKIYLSKYVGKLSNLLKFQSYMFLGQIEKENRNKSESCGRFIEANESYALISSELIDSNEKYKKLGAELVVELKLCD